MAQSAYAATFSATLYGLLPVVPAAGAVLGLVVLLNLLGNEASGVVTVVVMASVASSPAAPTFVGFPHET